MLKAKNLTKQYGKQVAVRDLSFELREGDVIALIGQNGAGKSTTIKMLLGLINPTEGKVEGLKKDEIGYLPEHPSFYNFLTGYELLKTYNQIFDNKKSHQEIISILKEIDMIEAMDKKMSQYSKGMLQRIGIAQSLIGDPKILILDEPMSGLDPMGRHMVKQIIEKQKNEGKTILICSHVLAEIQELADGYIMLHKGEVVSKGRMEKVIKKQPLEDFFIETIKRHDKKRV